MRAYGLGVDEREITMSKFIVTVAHNGETWPLRGTIWAFSMDRAQKFDTREAAQAALDKAKKFMKAALYRKAQIVEVAS
jgi:hypothetical protein